MTLTVIERAGGELHRAVGQEADLAEFAARRCRHFEVGTDRDAPQLAASAAFLLPLGKIGEIRNFQRFVEDASEIAAVIGHAGSGCERQLRRLDEVLLAQGDAVDPHLVGGAIDQPFHVVIGFGPSGAAIGPHQRGVGQDRLDVDGKQRRMIDARKIPADVDRQRHRRDAGDVGAEIAKARNAHRQELAFGIERELGMDQLRAALAVRQEAVGALVGPFHRAAQRLRRVQDAGIFGIVDVLHPE